MACPCCVLEATQYLHFAQGQILCPLHPHVHILALQLVARHTEGLPLGYAISGAAYSVVGPAGGIITHPHLKVSQTSATTVSSVPHSHRAHCRLSSKLYPPPRLRTPMCMCARPMPVVPIYITIHCTGGHSSPPCRGLGGGSAFETQQNCAGCKQQWRGLIFVSLGYSF